VGFKIAFFFARKVHAFAFGQHTEK